MDAWWICLGTLTILSVIGAIWAAKLQQSGFLWFLYFFFLAPIASIHLILRVLRPASSPVVIEDVCNYADPDCPVEIYKTVLADEGKAGKLCHIFTHSFVQTPIRKLVCQVFMLQDGQTALEISDYYQLVKDAVPVRHRENQYALPLLSHIDCSSVVVRILFIEFENGLRWEATPQHFFRYVLNPVTDHQQRVSTRDLFGDDALFSFYEQGDYWCCVCGRLNHLTSRCQRCGKGRSMLAGMFPHHHAIRNLEPLIPHPIGDTAPLAPVVTTLTQQQLSHVKAERWKNTRARIWSALIFGICVSFIWGMSFMYSVLYGLLWRGVL